ARPGGRRVGGALEPVALALGAGEARAHAGDLVLERDLARRLQREVVAQLGDHRVELRQRGVLAGDLLREEELHHHEDGEQEDDPEPQRRQRVDEARPVVQSALAAVTCKRHGSGFRRYIFCVSCTRISRSLRMSRCCSAWASTQSRIICCSERMWWIRPCSDSARLTMATVPLPPPVSTIVSRNRSIAARNSPPMARPAPPGLDSTPRSCPVVASQSSRSV